MRLTTFTGTAGRELIPDAAAHARLRRPDEPAMLKPLPSRDFLPCLLTMLHSIPQCRKALLAPNIAFADYGTNDHWWEGEPIETARVVNMNDDVQRLMHLDLLQETQRLMAFLSATSRSYGSAAALLSQSAMTSPGLDNRPFVRFLQTWDRARYATAELDDSKTLFHSELERYDGEGPSEPAFLSVSMCDHASRPTDSLYAALDSDIWCDNEDPYLFKRVAPVVVMQVQKVQSSTSITVPQFWYADRYHLDNVDPIMELRAEREGLYKTMQGIDQELHNLQFATHPHNQKKKIDSSKLLEATMSFLESDVYAGRTIRPFELHFVHRLTVAQI